MIQSPRKSLHLKLTASKDASRPEKAENVQIFPFVGFIGLHCAVFMQQKCFFHYLLQTGAPQGTSMLVHSSPVKSRQRLAHDTIHTCHTWQPCSWRDIHRMPDTKWQPSCHVLHMTVKHWFFRFCWLQKIICQHLPYVCQVMKNIVHIVGIQSL